MTIASDTPEAPQADEPLGTLAMARAKVPLSREPRTLREEQQRITREKLIRAAFDVFSEKSFNEVTINDIVALAGTSRATFYLHFASKSETLAAAWMELCQPAMHASWQQLNDMAVWDMPSLLEWSDDHLSKWENTRNFHLASMQAVATDPALTDRWYSGIEEFLQSAPRVLHRIAETGAVPEHRFILLCNLMERGAHLYFTGYFKAPRGELVREVASLWYQTLTAPTV